MQFETDMNFEYGGGRIPSQSSIGLLAGCLWTEDGGHGLGPSGEE